MVAWSAFRGGDAAWDAALARLPGANVFQSSAWARHKSDFGWRPLRALSGPAGSPLAAIQALVKTAGPARVLWARGGPVGDPASWNAGLREVLLREAGGALAYGRVCSYREADAGAAAALDAAGWTPPERPLDRPSTYLLDLTPEDEALRAAQSTNWRHNLKRGEARAVVAEWKDPDPAEMESLYLSLESLKGLPPQHRASSLGSLVRALGPSLILKRAIVDGKTVALRACAVFGESSVDLLAAAAGEARKVYASYALLWALILESKRRGARTYDLGGADAVAAPGVADFKKGTGARPIETLGERDFASPPFLRAPAGALIAWKLGKGA
jgi:hypothetical protein